LETRLHIDFSNSGEKDIQTTQFISLHVKGEKNIGIYNKCLPVRGT
jgi:hypothetical protein